MSLDGKIVFEKSILNQSKGNHVEKINLVDFSTGVYVCQVNNQNRVYSQKIIKF
jgi:O-acetyl-ADP-ribose deacetylase (regulator of RNase III)